MNTGVHVSLSILVSSVCVPSSGIAGSFGSWMNRLVYLCHWWLQQLPARLELASGGRCHSLVHWGEFFDLAGKIATCWWVRLYHMMVVAEGVGRASSWEQKAVLPDCRTADNWGLWQCRCSQYSFKRFDGYIQVILIVIVRMERALSILQQGRGWRYAYIYKPR